MEAMALFIIERYKLFDIYSHHCDLTLAEAIQKYSDDKYIPSEYYEFCLCYRPGNCRRCFYHPKKHFSD